MFEHLVQLEPEITNRAGLMKLGDASPAELLSAQVATADWMEELGIAPDEEVNTHAQTAAAREAFKVVVSGQEDLDTKERLVALKTPEAVRHLTGMLAAYDWEFVEMAKEIRGYTVAKLVEETKSPNANIRLKALGLLGKVTEVGLFTDKIEVKKVDLTEEEIDRKLKEKLAKFMNVSDAEYTDIEEIESTPATTAIPEDKDVDPENPDS